MSNKFIKQYGRISDESLLDIIYVLNKNENYIVEIIRYDGLHKYFLASYITSTIQDYLIPTPLHYFTKSYIYFYEQKPFNYKHDNINEYPFILNDAPERESYYYIHKYINGIPQIFGDISTKEYTNSSLTRIDINDPMIIYV